MSAVTGLVSDLTSCDVEPITRLERSQSFGFLLALSSHWVVVRASANLEAFIGIEARRSIGRPLDSLVDPEALHEIRNRMTGLSSIGGTERLYGVALVLGLPSLDLAVHYAGGLCILEGELAGQDSRTDAASVVRTMVARLAKHTILDGFHRDVVRQMRRLTGFGRVMIYRFDIDGTGEVIAEDAAAGMERFAGLHFPGADIPVQARALYLLNAFRIIADVGAETVPILAAPDDRGPPLDLSQAITRAVSPTHLEYLRNMGVAASLSISIIVGGRLWGLIACHDGAPRLPTFIVRTAAELFGEMYSLKLESRLRHAEDHKDTQARGATVRLLTAIGLNQELLNHAVWLQDALRELIDGDGIAACFEGRLSLSGSTPPAPAVQDIAAVIRRSPANHIVATDQIGTLVTGADDYAEHAAGVLCIPFLHSHSNYILVFRRERRHDFKWAGQPSKVERDGHSMPRLSPRLSFDVFTESIRGRSRPFTPIDLRVAEAIRAGLTELLMRGVQHVDAERQRATERQELLIAELNHRVRNVLALIRGLITQTSGADGEAASYVKSLNGRVQALARAHDRVTRQNWGPGPLNAIFDDEIAAYVPTQRHRFAIEGARVFLQPQAYSALALIIHELVTNCCKYGALSAKGDVKVTLEHRPTAGLYFKWRESGGPAVQVPTRRGFGSVIIDRILPFDLQGTALVHYHPEGLEADFFIPDQHIASVIDPAAGVAEMLASDPSVMIVAAPRARPLEGLVVLLVEDNLIVALESEDLLRGLGATAVYTASTVLAAANILKTEPVQFAMLDINLGGESSLKFALQVRAQKIPFIFASGYGENINLGGLNKAVTTVSKPYGREQLAVAIIKTLDADLLSQVRSGSTSA